VEEEKMGQERRENDKIGINSRCNLRIKNIIIGKNWDEFLWTRTWTIWRVREEADDDGYCLTIISQPFYDNLYSFSLVILLFHIHEKIS
jgi:hypothetical protein